MKPTFIIFSSVLICTLISISAKTQCPKSDAWIGGRQSGEFLKIVFQNQSQINADRFCDGVRRETNIDSFQVKIFRDKQIVFKSKNIGQRFNNDFKDAIKSIKADDKILFYDIIGTDYDGTMVRLNPLEYQITE